MNWILFAAALVGAYLVGSIPFGWIIGKCHGIDIRKAGSCNIGATNVTRVIGPKWGKLCFFLDFLKGLLPVLAVLFAGSDPNLPALTAFAVVAGHIWPLYLKFKGGKGISTAAGALGALSWPAVVIAFACWVIVFKISRYVSLASITASVVLPVSALILHLFGIGPHVSAASLILMFLLGILAIVKHRSNISRLIAGTENRFEKKASK